MRKKEQQDEQTKLISERNLPESNYSYSLSINHEKSPSFKSTMLWGAGFGISIVSSQLIFYSIFAVTSPKPFDLKKFLPIALPLLAFSALFGAIANKFYKKPLDVNKTYDINTLYRLVINERLLEFSWKQKILTLFLFLLFIAPNYLYVNTFKDVSNDAAGVLPTYNLSLYEDILNPQAGTISFITNLILNQWFAFGIIKDLISSYNLLKLTEKLVKKESSEIKKNVIKKLTLTLMLSMISSLIFFFLSLDDSSPKKLIITPYCAFIVYGLVLNTQGSMNVIESMQRLWNRIKGFPKWVSRTAPPANQSKKSPLIANKLKEEISKYISNKISGEGSEDSLRDFLIPKARKKLEKNKDITLNIWQRSCIRKALIKVFPWSGPAGLSVVLFGYFLLVNKTLANKIYKDVDLHREDPIARMISFYLFYPFIKLVIDSGYNTMNDMFVGLEHKIFEIANSIQVVRGKKCSKDFYYEDRFHPITTKEALRFTLSGLIFTLKIAIFFATIPSAGTILYLLKEEHYLNPFTLHVACWYSALFNTLGIVGFLNRSLKVAENRLNPCQKKQRSYNETFFTAMSDLESLGYQPNFEVPIPTTTPSTGNCTV